MPTITIREVDTSTAGAVNTTTNAVYVPGYASMGPINVPVLCETLESFQAIFGKEPYKYVEDEVPSTRQELIPTVHAGELETSYIYACDLLRIGLPVLFERVFTGNTEEWTASAEITLTKTSPGSDPETTTTVFNLKAAEPGLEGGNISYSISTSTRNYGEVGTQVTGTYFTLSASGNGKSGTTFFTFDEGLNQAYPSILYYSELETDVSGLIKFDFSTEGFETFIQLEEGDSLSISASGELGFTVAPTGNEFTPEGLYGQFSADPSIFKKLEDKGEYVFKFLTSGGYPTIANGDTSIADEMLVVSNNRGDVTALIDYSSALKINSTDTSLNAYTVIKNWASTLGNQNGEQLNNYGACFAPWCVFKSPTTKGKITLAPSFAYLSAYGTSTQTNANYYAAAGVVRGYIPNFEQPVERISNKRSNEIQPRDGISINPIVEVKPYGYVIWGNRTLKDNSPVRGGGELTATSFLNIRQLSNDVKRVVWVACKRCTFEPNSDNLWVKFRSEITPTLDQMAGNNGLTNYKITRLPTDKKATIVAKITLYCIEAVEDFDITIELTDSQITIVQ